MTDITELAQSLKAAAEKSIAEEGPTWFSEDQLAHDGGLALHEADAKFIALASHENILALVEALEKSQLVDDELCKLLPPGVEYMDPPDGGDVEPIEQVRRMVADYRQRIAELESRTVTDWIEHDGKWRPESLGLDELVYLKTRKQELKIPYPAGKVKGWMHTGGDMDIMAYKLVSPQARTVTVKLPRPGFITISGEHMAVYMKGEVVAALLAAGIKWEAE